MGNLWRVVSKNLTTGKITQGDYMPYGTALDTCETAKKAGEKTCDVWLEPKPHDAKPATIDKRC